MFLYIVKFKNIPQIKIGITSDFYTRHKSLSVDFGDIEDYLLYSTPNAKRYEERLHMYFQNERRPLQNGRGKTEFFLVSFQRCLDYLHGTGLKPKESHTNQVFKAFVKDLKHYDLYRATTKLRIFLKQILSKYPSIRTELVKEDFFWQWRLSTQEILMEYI